MNIIKFFSTLFALTSVSFSALAFDVIAPSEAYLMATEDPNAFIVDVRTDAEWQWVGHPGANKLGEGVDLDGKVVNVSWKIVKKKNWMVNPSFITDMNDMFADKDNVKLLMICRSGGRAAAAATALEADGYANVSNIEHGFEGSTDAYGYRTLNGWKVDGLPYKASATDKYPD